MPPGVKVNIKTVADAFGVKHSHKCRVLTTSFVLLSTTGARNFVISIRFNKGLSKDLGYGLGAGYDCDVLCSSLQSH